jgi:hypothetical protein
VEVRFHEWLQFIWSLFLQEAHAPNAPQRAIGTPHCGRQLSYGCAQHPGLQKEQLTSTRVEKRPCTLQFRTIILFSQEPFLR